MINKNKIEWLGNQFGSLPKFRRKSTHESNIESLQFIKKEVERLKNMLSHKLSSNERYEIYKMLNRSIRRAQDIYKEVYNIHYVEKFEENSRRVKEHVIPQNLLTDAYLEAHLTFETMIGMPLVDLSEASDQLIAGKGLAKLNSNWMYPFMRYRVSGIQENIYTPSGNKINFQTWSLEDHFSLYPEIKL